VNGGVAPAQEQTLAIRQVRAPVNLTWLIASQLMVVMSTLTGLVHPIVAVITLVYCLSNIHNGGMAVSVNNRHVLMTAAPLPQRSEAK
jgi:hypothetical protein